MQRWRGLVALVEDAVEHGSRAVERVQKETARRPFEILEQIPPLRAPARGVRLVFDVSVSGVHGMIRLVNRMVGRTLATVLNVVEEATARDGGPAEPPGPEPGSAAKPDPAPRDGG